MKSYIEKSVITLGGTIVNEIGLTTRIIFHPGKPCSNELMFLFATAAISGRYLLPFRYIEDCKRVKKFVPVDQYDSFKAYQKFSTLASNEKAAIKMSIKIRTEFVSLLIDIFYIYEMNAFRNRINFQSFIANIFSSVNLMVSMKMFDF